MRFQLGQDELGLQPVLQPVLRSSVLRVCGRRHAPDRAASAAQPERVFAEVFRVLKPGGCCIMTFSNRLYYEKVRAVPSQAQWSPGLHCETVLAAPDQASMLSCLAL